MSKKLFNYNTLNFLFFQLGWLVCVFGATNNYPWAGVYFAIAFLILHFYWQRSLTGEVVFIGFVALFGLAMDTLWNNLGYIEYAPLLDGGSAPAWIVALWAMFAATIGHSLYWFRDKPYLASLLGAVLGPTAYYAAANIGAINLLEGESVFLILGLAWAAVLPSLFVIREAVVARRHSRRQVIFSRKSMN